MKMRIALIILMSTFCMTMFAQSRVVQSTELEGKASPVLQNQTTINDNNQLTSTQDFKDELLRARLRNIKVFGTVDRNGNLHPTPSEANNLPE